MAGVVVPVAKGLYLCDFHIGFADGKVDLYGVFDAVRPPAYPYVKNECCCFARLSGGLGEMSIFVDIRRADDWNLVHCTEPRSVQFPDRQMIVNLALTIRKCRFSVPGMYVAQIFCDNTWVADTRFELLEPDQ